MTGNSPSDLGVEERVREAFKLPQGSVWYGESHCADGQVHLWTRRMSDTVRCARCNLAAPYPFCSRPDKCAGTGRCMRDWVCND